MVRECAATRTVRDPAGNLPSPVSPIPTTAGLASTQSLETSACELLSFSAQGPGRFRGFPKPHARVIRSTPARFVADVLMENHPKGCEIRKTGQELR